MSLLSKLIMIFALWRRTLIAWAPLWANVLLIILDWNSCFARKKFHMFMNISYRIHMHHHAHTHTTHMHARVYTCTHCGRKGHLARFWFDRLTSINFTTKNIWVPYNTNPHWAQKGKGTKVPTSCIWYRCGLSQNVRGLVPWWWMYVKLYGHTLLMHRYQGSLVGDHHVLKT